MSTANRLLSEVLPAELIFALIEELGDVETVAGREYTRSGTPFAAQPTEHAVEIRLGQEIAEAARRTPDTHASARGDAWVLFAPRQWDEQAADRLEAWFRVAWRRVADQ